MNYKKNIIVIIFIIFITVITAKSIFAVKPVEILPKKATSEAKLVKIQKHRRVFIGIIKSLRPETAELVLTTQKRGDQSVAPDKNTKYVNIKMKAIKFEDFQIGHRIRVKGTWDNKLNQIFEVTQIKTYGKVVNL